MWRMRVVHATGYAYNTTVTASYNEARLTPRSDSRQNVIINRVETTPATRSYRYVDYWGTAVTAFDLHAPHTELEVTSSSVVETDRPEPAAAISDAPGALDVDPAGAWLGPPRHLFHETGRATLGVRR
jgi:transglutaminase-like putative cysteine protease